MKHYRRIIFAVIAVSMGLILAVNLLFLREQTEAGRPYLVEISRICEAIANGGSIPDLSECKYVISVEVCSDSESVHLPGKLDETVRFIDGSLYRFAYRAQQDNSRQILGANLAMAAMLLMTTGVLLFVERSILRPFTRLEAVPYELSKGNLTIPLKENRARFFGKFLWGLDLLRENLEENRRKELAMHRDQKLMIRSLTHDMKTPMSVIKLQAQALERGLYADAERQRQYAHAIVEKVQEMERYVGEINHLSTDDFLNLTVHEEEFYLSAVVEPLRAHYTDRLALLHTRFVVGKYSDCILSGDPDRLVEVLQNFLENAIKYGDGREIRVEFSREEDCQLIRVVNTGNSLLPEELPHIFDSFYRGSNVGDAPGTGLGLYICRTLMQRMRGEVFAQCDAAEFSVTAVIPM